ncbi:MAG: hypothetical protein E7068_04090 [Lentimicrobiaceae bacterium]|nr:hypothetical protein [Lentimicrobiaceae bacterium]
MAGGKETPRQKMISMMYLVLTALLALNVSVDILDAFAIVNDGIETSNNSVENKIKDYYLTFEQQYEKQPEKAGEYWNKAQEIRVKTDEIINYIETEIKLPLVEVTEGITKEEIFNPKDEKKKLIKNADKADPEKNRRIFHEFEFKNISAKDNYDAPTNFMINEGKATELRNKLEDYRLYIISTLQSAGLTNYGSKVGLRTDGDYYDANNNKLSWEEKNFYHVILLADIAILNKIIGEIQTTEFDAVSELFKRIGATDYKFNALEAKVFPKTTYVLQGQDYEADIFIAASDTTRKFNAKFAKGVKDFSKANSKNVYNTSSKNGVVSIKIPTSAEGEQTFAGIVEMVDPETGEIVPYPFSSSFTVAPPSANVTPTKMNVMYRGLENPISISAPGFTANQINVSVSNGELIKGNNGEYFVKPGNEKNITTVTVSTTIDGKKVILDNCDFRLKRTPDPVPVINGKTKGSFTKEEILAAGGFNLTMPDFDFEGYRSQVISYDVSTIVAGYLKSVKGIKGRQFNSEVEELIKSSKRISIENIRVKSPDGEERILDTPITIDIKN